VAKILIVDDEESLRELYHSELAEEGTRSPGGQRQGGHELLQRETPTR